MSAEEMSIQEHAAANGITNKPGRLGIKETIALMYIHIFGLNNKEKVSTFRLHNSSGEIALILVDTIRMEISNQPVFLDAPIVPSHPDTDAHIKQFLATMPNQNIVLLIADDNEVPFWLHLLPICAEGCRSWIHKSTCEYRATGAGLPLSTKLHDQIMCTCGSGIFPNDYLKNLESFKQLSKYAVRAAIPVIYASPMSCGALPAAPKGPAMPEPAVSASKNPAKFNPAVPASAPSTMPLVEDLDEKKRSCFACGAKTAKEGEALLKCGSCKIAQYCSRECQRGD
jgi:hypothetical protein